MRVQLKSPSPAVPSVGSTSRHAHAPVHVTSEVPSSTKFLALVLSHAPALLPGELVTEVVVEVVAEVVLVVVGRTLSPHHVAVAAPGAGGVVPVVTALVVTVVVHTAAHRVKIPPLAARVPVSSTTTSAHVAGEA